MNAPKTHLEPYKEILKTKDIKRINKEIEFINKDIRKDRRNIYNLEKNINRSISIKKYLEKELVKLGFRYGYKNENKKA